jgi:hypothetical protein
MPDINSYLDSVTSSIKQVRDDVLGLQQQERPDESSGLAANRPTTSLRTGQRYFSTNTGAYEYYTGSAWATVGGSTSTPVGTTFPASPTTGQKYIRSDRHYLEYYFDGTRWLSVQIFKEPFISRSTQPFAQATTVFEVSLVEYTLGSGIYITNIAANFTPVTISQGSSNFYTIVCGIIDTLGAITNLSLTGGTQDTKLMTTVGAWRPLVPTFTPIVFGTTFPMPYVQMTPSGAPGTFYMNATIQYQLVG